MLGFFKLGYFDNKIQANSDDCVNSFFFNSKLSTKSGRRADNEKQTPNRLEGGGVSG